MSARAAAAGSCCGYGTPSCWCSVRGGARLAVVGGAIGNDLFGAALSLIWEVASFLVAGVAGAAAYAYVYAFVPSPPRPPRDALAAGALVGMLIWILATIGFRIFADLWRGYDTNYGVFATRTVRGGPVFPAVFLGSPWPRSRQSPRRLAHPGRGRWHRRRTAAPT